jgi:hypothetical protein
MIPMEAVQVLKLMMREAELTAERARLVMEAKQEERDGGVRRAAGARLVRLGLWLMGPAAAAPARPARQGGA